MACKDLENAEKLECIKDEMRREGGVFVDLDKGWENCGLWAIFGCYKVFCGLPRHSEYTP